MARRALVLKALKRRGRQPRGQLPGPARIITPDLDDKDRFFVIEKLIGKRFNYDENQIEYLVRWKNYPPSEDTWEPVDELNINAADMVYEYEFGRVGRPTSEKELHCVCRKPYNSKDGGMVQCYNCSVWFHFHCINMDMEIANSYLRFFCKLCRDKNPTLKCIIKPEKAKFFYNRQLSGEI